MKPVGGSRRWLLVLTVVAALGACKHPVLSGATGSVMYDPQMAGVDGDSVDVVMATEVEVLKSHGVLLDALREYRLHELPSLQCTEDEAANRIEEWIQARRRGESTVIDVTVAHEDPGLAQQVCSGVLRAYVQSHLDEKNAEILWKRKKGLEVDATLYENEVRILDHCEIFAPGKR